MEWQPDSPDLASFYLSFTKILTTEVWFAVTI